MENRASEIDKTYVINANRWVLTMARKTNGSHQQHTFLIVEGIQYEKAVIWFMDLVGPGMSVWLPNVMDAHIRIEPFIANSKAEMKEESLLFRCKKRMMDLKTGDKIAQQHWFIDQVDALKLIDAITKDKERPPVFNILGKDSVITGSSAKSSSKEKGHNCFTYAKEKINDLNVLEIKIVSDRSAYYIEQVVGISSLTLKGEKKNSALYCPSYKKILLAAATGGAVCIAALAIKSASSYYDSP